MLRSSRQQIGFDAWRSDDGPRLLGEPSDGDELATPSTLRISNASQASHECLPTRVTMRPIATFILVVSVLATTACTTVQLDEEVLFQGKETVVPGDFPHAG